MLEIETSDDFLASGSRHGDDETFLSKRLKINDMSKFPSYNAYDDDMELEGSEEPLTGDEDSFETAGSFGLLDSYFDMGDQDGDGSLTEAEFKQIIAIFSQQNGAEPGDIDVSHIFAIIDKDNDGKITKSEFFEAFRTSFLSTEEPPNIEGEGCESDGDFDERVYTSQQSPRGQMETRVHTLELQNQELVNENRALSSLVKKMEKHRDQLNLQLKEYKKKEASVDKLHADLLRLSTECEDYKEKVASWERKHEALKKNYEKLRENEKDTTPLEKSLSETTAKVVELEEFILSLQQELQFQKKNEERTQRLLDDSERRNLALQLEHNGKVEEMQAHSEQLVKELRQMKAMYQSMEREYNNMKQLQEEIPSPVKAPEQQRLSLDAEFIALLQAQELPLGKSTEKESEETEVTGKETEKSVIAKELLRLKEENDELKKEKETLLLRVKKLSLTEPPSPTPSPSANLFNSTPSFAVSPLPATPSTPLASSLSSPSSSPSPSPSSSFDSSPPARTPPRVLRRTISTPASPITPGFSSSMTTPISTLTTPTRRKGSTFRGSLRLPLPREPFLTPPPKSQSMRILPTQSADRGRGRADRLISSEKGREKVRTREIVVTKEREKGKEREREREREKAREKEIAIEKEERKRNEEAKGLLRMQVDSLQKKLGEEKERNAELQALLNRANEKIEAGRKRSAAFAAIADRVSLTHAIGLGVLLLFAFVWIVVRLLIALSPSLFTPS